MQGGGEQPLPAPSARESRPARSALTSSKQLSAKAPLPDMKPMRKAAARGWPRPPPPPPAC